MKRGLIIIGVVVLGLAGLGGMALMTFLQVDMARRALSLGECNVSVVVNVGGVTDRARADAAALSPESKAIVARIIEIGKQRGHEPKAWQVAIQAGKTESNLRNVNYGDRDSLGIFQMRPSMGWGTPAQVTNVDYAINTFYERLHRIKNWQAMRPGDAAQAVERSAYPDRYNRWEGMAAMLISGIETTVADPTKCAENAPASEVVNTAMSFVMGQKGKGYEWGGVGPLEFDCSGLMMIGYRNAGVAIPRTSREQYAQLPKVPLSDLQSGDLVFWATNKQNPGTIHHVAMYVGDGQIVEAPYEGKPISQRKLSMTERELVPLAARPAPVAPTRPSSPPSTPVTAGPSSSVAATPSSSTVPTSSLPVTTTRPTVGLPVTTGSTTSRVIPPTFDVSVPVDPAATRGRSPDTAGAGR